MPLALLGAALQEGSLGSQRLATGSARWLRCSWSLGLARPSPGSGCCWELERWLCGDGAGDARTPGTPRGPLAAVQFPTGGLWAGGSKSALGVGR